MTVAAAHKNVLAAEQRLSDAERERDEALAELDEALRLRGWVREYGAFAGRLYSQLGGNLCTLDQVLDFEMRTAA